jgi:hypothetical protein
MITQSIKHWLRKMFAWWPWRQAQPVEYNHVSGPLSKVTPEGVSLSTIDGTAPQTSITPRLSTIEERSERLAQTPSSDLAETPVLPPVTPAVDMPTEPPKEDISPVVPATPTPQQRLEFMRYLVKRGIVNEGFEKK